MLTETDSLESCIATAMAEFLSSVSELCDEEEEEED